MTDRSVQIGQNEATTRVALAAITRPEPMTRKGVGTLRSVQGSAVTADVPHAARGLRSQKPGASVLAFHLAPLSGVYRPRTA
jgi:hypothetical protein